MNGANLAVGVPMSQTASEWDFWLPAYILLSFLLMVGFVRVPVTWRLGVASFLAGTLWAWVDNAVGVIPAAALAVLVAVLAGAIRSRRSALGDP
jgi:hypothetical protein